MALDKVHLNSGEVMAPLWDNFSPSTNRGAHHEFLAETLQGSRRIFEACLGSGTDAIALAERGFNIVGNEADPSYHNVAEENLRNHNTDIALTQLDWRVLLEQEELAQTFDGVICVGNSICYLFKREDVVQAIRGFHALLKEGGKLVIDERNFEWMLEHRDEILEDLPRREEIARSHQGMHGYLYGGDKYFPYPLEITQERVRMGMWEYGKEAPLTELHFYPYRRNELQGILKQVFGSDNVTQYSDYKEEADSNAAFYQYVCTK